MIRKKQENTLTWKNILQFLKEYGFLIQSDEIYGGLFSVYNSGPASVELKNQIKKEWWNFFVKQKSFIYGFESSILTHAQTLKASGHVDRFIDSFYLCKNCGYHQNTEDLIKKIDQKRICFKCKKINNFKHFEYNLLFETQQGVEEGKKNKIYLRPETAQGIFTNFNKIKQIWKINLPFGLGQIGKAFRNELTTKYANFKSCEFEMLEIEFFFANKKDSLKWFNYWKKEIWTFLQTNLKIKKQNIKEQEASSADLAHYAQKTVDFEYKFPFGWKEIWGLCDRGDYDLTKHQSLSKTNLSVLHGKKQEKIIPYVIEPSAGVERLMLAMIVENLKYKEDKFTLQLPFAFCYYQIAILPLTEKLKPIAEKITKILEKNYSLKLDAKKSIGKRYLFHDAIGTFFCITVDFETNKDQKVTIRNRDTKKQKRVTIKDLNQHIQNEL